MECREAQQVISERMDGAPVDVAELEQAKQHVRECATCTRFVNAMRTVHDAPLPQPPADLADRVMAAVRAEAENTETAPTPAPQPEVRAPRDRASVVRWLSAAAVVLVVVAVGTAVGVNSLLSGNAVSETSSREAAFDTAAPEMGGAAQSAPKESGAAVTAPLDQVAPTSAAPAAITVDGIVFVSAGEASAVDAASLKQVGSTTTALDSGGAPTTYAVLGLQDPGRVYVKTPAGLVAFDRVTRSIDGALFAQESGTLTAYGEWPSLPADVPQPTTPDGAPTFVPDGTGSLGIPVYRLASGSTGRAVAPGTPATDPAAGNPGWTWWVPAE